MSGRAGSSTSLYVINPTRVIASIGGSAGVSPDLYLGRDIVEIVASIGSAISTSQRVIVSAPSIISGVDPLVAWAMEISGIGDLKVPYRVWSWPRAAGLEWRNLGRHTEREWRFCGCLSNYR